MITSIRFNEKALNNVIQQAAQRVADLHQQALDQVLAECKGQPIDEIRPLLAARWTEVNGGHLTEHELSAWSSQIAAGQRIEFVVQPASR